MLKSGRSLTLSTSIPLFSFDEVWKASEAAGGKRHILFGNGFSIGAHDKFRYGTLYEQVLSAGLPSHVEALFGRYGTTNFEEVLRMLNEGQWLSNHYRLTQSDPELDMEKDYLIVKQSLVQSISENHPAFPAELAGGMLDSALVFLQRFNNVFTTNYDLLPYWASLHDDTFPFSDGFGREFDTDHRYCVFLPTGTNDPQVYFLHGALHLYAAEGEVRKMVWNTTGEPLMDQVKESLDNERYPLIVSEGDSVRKLERIESSSYLSHCARRFQNIQGNLFIYGSSLSEQDDHIIEWIGKNTTLPRIFVGIHGDLTTESGVALVDRVQKLQQLRQKILDTGSSGRRFRRESLDVAFYQSETADVWQEDE